MYTFLIIASFILTPVILYILAAVGVTIYLLKMSKQVQPECDGQKICVLRDSAYWRIVDLYYSLKEASWERGDWENNANLCPTTRKFFWGVVIYPFVVNYRKIAKKLTTPIKIDKGKFEQSLLKKMYVHPEEVTPLNVTITSVMTLLIFFLTINFAITFFFTLAYGFSGMLALPIWQLAVGVIAIIAYVKLANKMLGEHGDEWLKKLEAFLEKYPWVKTIWDVIYIVGLIIFIIMLMILEFLWGKFVKLLGFIWKGIASVGRDFASAFEGAFDPFTNFFYNAYHAVKDFVLYEIPHDLEIRGRNTVWGDIDDALIENNVPVWPVIPIFAILAFWITVNFHLVAWILYGFDGLDGFTIFVSIVLDLILIGFIAYAIYDSSSNVDRQVSLLKGWLKARHDRMCPPIEFRGNAREEKS